MGGVNSREAASPLGANNNAIFHFGDARRRPGHALGLPPFGPRPHGAFEDNLATIRFDDNAVGVDLGAAAERLLNLSLEFGRLNARFQLD